MKLSKRSVLMVILAAVLVFVAINWADIKRGVRDGWNASRSIE